VFVENAVNVTNKSTQGAKMLQSVGRAYKNFGKP
jgi:hypothetical protein